MFETRTYEDPMVLDFSIQNKWTFMETSSAAAVLRSVCPDEWKDIVDVLREFSLAPTHWLKKGGNRGDIAKTIDGMFSERGWREIRVDLATQGVLVNQKGNAEILSPKEFTPIH